MDIDAVIAEATQVAPQAEATEVATDPVAPKEEVQEEDVSSKADSELTPEQLAKREANRESHRNSREAKLRRELRELREYRAQQEAKVAAPPPPPSDGRPVAPNADDFSNLIEYMEAKDKYQESLYEWKLEQKISELTPKKETESQPALEPRIAERINEAAQKEEEFIKAVPEYAALYQKHEAFFDGLPKPIAEALVEAEDAPLALYALMKEDRLLDLEDLSPMRLAMEIGMAQERGKSYVNSNKATNASAPITPLKGTGNTGKSLNEMSVKELMKQFNR